MTTNDDPKTSVSLRNPTAPLGLGLLFVGLNDVGIAELVWATSVPTTTQAWAWALADPICPSSGRTYPWICHMRALIGGGRRRTTFTRLACMCNQAGGRHPVIGPRESRARPEQLEAALGRLKASRLQVEQWRLHGPYSRCWAVLDSRLGPWPRGLGRHHQPARGHPIVHITPTRRERVVSFTRCQVSPLSASVITGGTNLSVLGMRETAQRVEVGRVVLVVQLASATRYRGLGAVFKVAISAWARSWKILVSEVLPSPLWLTKGTPPSWDTSNAKTACSSPGRWSLRSRG